MLKTPPPIALATYYLVVTNSPAQNVKVTLTGINWQTTYGSVRYLLAFSGVAVPSNGALPIMAPILLPTSGAGQQLLETPLPIPAPGLVLVVSSTAASLTVDASATVTFSALVEEWNQVRVDVTTVGDLTTAVSSLAVWADSAGPKRLTRVRVKNNVSSVRYLCVYATDAPASTDKLISWHELAADEDKEISFGVRGGIVPKQKDADGTIHDACTLFCQSVLTPGSEAAATDFNIQAEYVTA